MAESTNGGRGEDRPVELILGQQGQVLFAASTTALPSRLKQ